MKRIITVSLLFIGLTISAVAQTSFGLLSPPNNAFIVNSGNVTNQIDITWNDGGATIQSYKWYVALASAGMGTPLDSSLSNNSGADTVLTINTGIVDNLLAALGNNLGDTSNLVWTVVATDINGVLVPSSDTFNVNLIRGQVYNDFGLIAPADGATLVLNGNSSSSATITWNSAGTGFGYAWLANLSGFGFNPAALNLPSNNSGADTSLTFTYAALNTTLGTLGANVGDTVTLDWTVVAAGLTDTVGSIDTFTINLVRGVVLDQPVLTTPNNNTNLSISGPSTNTATATWKGSGGTGTSYIWQYDNQFGNFSNPKFAITTTDTFLTIDYDTLRDLLVAEAVPLNGFFLGKWRVRATNSGYTVNSTTSRNLNLVRGTVLDPFDLTAPTSGTTLSVDGPGSQTVTIDWEDAGFGAAYNWYLRGPSPLTDTLITVPTGLNADSLVLSFDAIDQLLEDNNVPVGATVPFSWNVAALSNNGNIASANGPFNISITRGNVIKSFNYLAPANNTSLVFFGNASKTLEVSWQQSGPNITYVWELDSAGAGFSSPLLAIPTNTDTSLSLDYATVEGFLISTGVAIGDVVNYEWRVYATNGTDTVFNAPFALDLERQPVISAFNLIAPANNASLTVEGGSVNLVEAIWESGSVDGATYEWQLDTLGGNFNAPYLTLSSDLSGLDSMLTLDFGTIDGFLESLGIGLTETLSTTWRVRIISLTDTIVSTSSNNLDLIRGSVMYPFNLVSPSNNAGLTNEGLDTDVISATWNPSSDTLTTYEWILDTVGGNFANPILRVPATDTTVGFTTATLNQLLISLGVPYNDFKTFEWYVEAYTGGDTLPSQDTFRLSLSRGTVLSNFTQIGPSNGTLLRVEGDGNQSVDITWNSASPTGRPIYDWLIDLPSGNFSSPLLSVVSNNNGADTVLSLTYNQIDGLLANLGLSVGDTLISAWSARATGGFKTLLATNNPYIITLVRGEVLRPFDLNAPANNLTLEVTGNRIRTADISWTSAGTGSVSYEWLIDVPGGDFSNPLATVNSNNSGADTLLNLGYTAIENLLIANGLNIGDTIDAIWDVRATNVAGDAFSTNGPFNISLVRGSVIKAFGLNNPADNTRLLVQGDATTPVNIDWASAGNGNYNYEWLLDVPGGNFSPPLASLPADNNGMDETLTLDFAAVDGLLNSLGVNLGDSVEAIWTVRADEGNDVVQSTNVFNIKFVRGALTVPFNLIGPADGTILSISGNSTQSLNVSWENGDFQGSTNSLNYDFVLDETFNNFFNPLLALPSSNGGKGTSITIPYNSIYSFLNSQGLALGDSKTYHWTVIASLLDLEERAENSHDITFIKNENVGLGETLSGMNTKIYPSPSNGQFTVEFDSDRNGYAEIELIDVVGKIVHTSTRNILNGKNLMMMNVDAPAGFYFIKVKSGDYQFEDRLTIVK